MSSTFECRSPREVSPHEGILIGLKRCPCCLDQESIASDTPA
jgi:hypothetical protein